MTRCAAHPRVLGPHVTLFDPHVTLFGSRVTLPVTGASGAGNILAIAFVLVSVGFVLVRRRRTNIG